MKLFEVIETKKKVFLITEHVCRVDLHSYLKHHGCLSEIDAPGIFWKLVSAVQYCHQRGVVHRDLKPENGLLDSEVNLKHIGFGLNEEFMARSRAWCVATSLMPPRALPGP